MALTPEQLRERDQQRRAAGLSPGPEPAASDDVDLFVRADWRDAQDGDAIVWDDEDRAWIPSPVLAQSGSVPEDTADTFEPYKVILLSNGTVRAIPVGTGPPVAPTGLGATARIASVGLGWTASPTSSATYAVFRDGVQIGTTTALTYRDDTVVPGATYAYRVQTVDRYGQRSALTAAVTAFIDPALNQAPVAAVKTWPPAHRTDGKTLIRVNASDVDAQSLTIGLGVDSGFLQATDDPSVWYYTPA